MSAAAAAIRTAVQSGQFIDELDDIPDVYTLDGDAIEGRLLGRRHFSRERDRKLRQKKIDEHLATNSGLVCHTCGFDFHAAYGIRGEGYIECHHVVPLHASGETRTRLKDLVLICANCHRMIHRRNPWLTPDQLLELTAAQYDQRRQESDVTAPRLIWRRTEPQQTDGYDVAFETNFNNLVFWASRSRAGSSWRLERDNPATGQFQAGISHEASLLASKIRLEREIATKSWVVDPG